MAEWIIGGAKIICDICMGQEIFGIYNKRDMNRFEDNQGINSNIDCSPQFQIQRLLFLHFMYALIFLNLFSTLRLAGTIVFLLILHFMWHAHSEILVLLYLRCMTCNVYCSHMISFTIYFYLVCGLHLTVFFLLCS